MAHRTVCPSVEMTRAGTVIYATASLQGCAGAIHAFVTETRHYDLYHNGNPRLRLSGPSGWACRAPQSPGTRPSRSAACREHCQPSPDPAGKAPTARACRSPAARAARHPVARGRQSRRSPNPGTGETRAQRSRDSAKSTLRQGRQECTVSDLVARPGCCLGTPRVSRTLLIEIDAAAKRPPTKRDAEEASLIRFRIAVSQRSRLAV